MQQSLMKTLEEQGHCSSNCIKEKIGKDSEPNHCPRTIEAPVQMDNEVRVKSHPMISKCCYKCKGDHLARNCHIKRDWTYLIEIEYCIQDLEELLALETSKKKKKNLSDVICFKCKGKGHYADKCPEKMKEKCLTRPHKKIISPVTCRRYGATGHYVSGCPEWKKNKSLQGPSGKREC